MYLFCDLGKTFRFEMYNLLHKDIYILKNCYKYHNDKGKIIAQEFFIHPINQTFKIFDIQG